MKNIRERVYSHDQKFYQVEEVYVGDGGGSGWGSDAQQYLQPIRHLFWTFYKPKRGDNLKY